MTTGGWTATGVVLEVLGIEVTGMGARGVCRDCSRAKASRLSFPPTGAVPRCREVVVEGVGSEVTGCPVSGLVKVTDSSDFCSVCRVFACLGAVFPSSCGVGVLPGGFFASAAFNGGRDRKYMKGPRIKNKAARPYNGALRLS